MPQVAERSITGCLSVCVQASTMCQPGNGYVHVIEDEVGIILAQYGGAFAKAELLLMGRCCFCDVRFCVLETLQSSIGLRVRRRTGLGEFRI